RGQGVEDFTHAGSQLGAFQQVRCHLLDLHPSQGAEDAVRIAPDLVATEEVADPVPGDAQEPGGGRGGVPELGAVAPGLDQGLLDEVIDVGLRKPGGAGDIAMEVRIVLPEKGLRIGIRGPLNHLYVHLSIRRPNFANPLKKVKRPSPWGGTEEGKIAAA